MSLLDQDLAKDIESAIVTIRGAIALTSRLAMMIDPVDAALIAGTVAGLDKMLEVVSVMVNNDSEAKAVEALKAARAKVVDDWKARLADHKAEP